jgi:septal ring-binding cell division protein DamX
MGYGAVRYDKNGKPIYTTWKGSWAQQEEARRAQKTEVHSR